MAYTIRRAGEQDVEAIGEVHRASIFGLCMDHYDRDQKEDWVVSLEPDQVRQAILQGDAVVVVADDEESILGFAVLSGDVIRALYVHPNVSRRGVGRSLLQALEGEAVRRNVEKLRLFASLNSRPFYEANAYVALRRAEYPLSKTQTMTCLEMEKILPTPPDPTLRSRRPAGHD